MTSIKTSLILAMNYLKLARERAIEVERGLYMDDNLRENEECQILAKNLLLAIEDAKRGVDDDLEAFKLGINHKPTVTYVDFKENK